MGVRIDPAKCTACMACELACGYHRDDAFALLSSCIVAYRAKEKKNYFGVLLKEEDSLVIARPEGVEVQKLGEASDNKDSGDSSAKPMLLREACDLCDGVDEGPFCLRFCPTGAIFLE